MLIDEAHVELHRIAAPARARPTSATTADGATATSAPATTTATAAPATAADDAPAPGPPGAPAPAAAAATASVTMADNARATGAPAASGPLPGASVTATAAVAAPASATTADDATAADGAATGPSATVIAARRLLIAVNASAAKTASEADAVLCGLPRREYDANVLGGAVPTTLGTMTTSSAAHGHLVNPVYTATKTRFAHIENLVHMRIRVVTTSFTLRHGTFLFAFFC